MSREEVKAAELRKYDSARLNQIESEVRKDQNMLRMDVYADRRELSKSKRNLKLNLARILTIKNEMKKRSS
jgi:ribosomal protein L29